MKRNNAKSEPYVLRYAAKNTIRKLFSGHTEEISTPLSDLDELTVFVWNIFKQKRTKWQAMLKNYAHDSQLVLLQEAYTTPELIDYAIAHYNTVEQVPALSIAEYTSGVMTLSTAPPIYCCPLQKQEPLIRLHKSALITVYPLKTGENLMVANIHAINFSFGVVRYQQQLDDIIKQIKLHRGPIIMAGDFNSWSKRRLGTLEQITQQTGLIAVSFEKDYRKKIFGKPLDFIFYRDLNVRESTIFTTNSSDHNPMLVKFNIKT